MQSAPIAKFDNSVRSREIAPNSHRFIASDLASTRSVVIRCYDCLSVHRWSKSRRAFSTKTLIVHIDCPSAQRCSQPASATVIAETRAFRAKTEAKKKKLLFFAMQSIHLGSSHFYSLIYLPSRKRLCGSLLFVVTRRNTNDFTVSNSCELQKRHCASQRALLSTFHLQRSTNWGICICARDEICSVMNPVRTMLEHIIVSLFTAKSSLRTTFL